MKKYKMKTSFVRPDRPKARDNKTGINFMITIKIFVGNCVQYVTIHDILVWPRTGSIQTDNNRFRSHTG